MKQRQLCYDYLECDPTDCPMFKDKSENPCWALATVEHTHPFFQVFVEKGIIESLDTKCEICVYRNAFNNEEHQ